jgi:hypothetical protein
MTMLVFYKTSLITVLYNYFLLIAGHYVLVNKERQNQIRAPLHKLCKDNPISEGSWGARIPTVSH